MHSRTSWFVGAVFGAVCAVSLVIACSDDSPGDADAAVCDCPAAEPPLAGRIMTVRASNPLTPGTGGGQGAFCPAGAKVLGGACDVMVDDPVIQVQSSRFLNAGGQEGYQCLWSGINQTVANTGIVEAICLLPAQ